VVGEALCKEVMGIPKVSILHKEVSSYNFMGQPTIKEVFTKVYDVDLSRMEIYQSGEELVITGNLKIGHFRDKEGNQKETRTLDAIKVEYKNKPEKSTNEAAADDMPF
jgi:hypothetical protein